MINAKLKTKNNNPETKLLIIIVIFITILIIIGVLIGTGFLSLSKIKKIFTGDKKDIEISQINSNVNTTSSRNAYDIALEKAKQWQSDVALSFIDTVSLDSNGNPKTWKLTFVSKNMPEKGFLVEVDNGIITNSKEIEYSGTGAELPTNIISQQQAIERVKKMADYEDVEILGVEAVYGQGTEVWYWGVKTDKGVVSVQAND